MAAPTSTTTAAGYRGVSLSRSGHVQAQYGAQVVGALSSTTLAARAYDLVCLHDRGDAAEPNFPREDYALILPLLAGASVDSVLACMQAYTRASGKRKTSRYTGVSRKKGSASVVPFEAYMHHPKNAERPSGQRKEHIGVFSTEEEAARAVDRSHVRAGLPPPNFPPEREAFARQLYDFLESHRPADPNPTGAAAPAEGEREERKEGAVTVLPAAGAKRKRRPPARAYEGGGTRLTAPYRQRRRSDVFAGDDDTDDGTTETDSEVDLFGAGGAGPGVKGEEAGGATSLQLLAEAGAVESTPPPATRQLQPQPTAAVQWEGSGASWDRHLSAAAEGLLCALLPEGRAQEPGPRAAAAGAIVSFLGDLMGRLEGAGEALVGPGSVLRVAGSATGGLLT